MIISGTGHRPHKLGNDYTYQGRVSRYVIAETQKIIDAYRPKKIISGLALGFDTILAVLAIKNNVPLTVAIPFEGQEKNWPPESQKIYRKLVSLAARVVIVCEGGYAPWKMQKRNEWMVDELKDEKDRLVACWDGTDGGTANCIRYAERTNKKYIRINPVAADPAATAAE